MNKKLNKFDKAMMDTAKIWAALSSCNKLKVGAVIAYDNRIISNGYNGTTSGVNNNCEDTVLACSKCEHNIIIKNYDSLNLSEGTVYETDCPKCGTTNKCTTEWLKDNVRLKTNSLVLHAEQNAILDAAKYGKKLDASTLYITHSPCSTCALMIKAAGIKKVIYLNDYKDDSGINYLENNGVEIFKMEI